MSPTLVMAIGEMVQQAAHAHGVTGPMEFTVCRRGSFRGPQSMSTTTTKTYTAEQAALVQAITSQFDVQPDEVVFFGDDPRPLLAYEATCVIANQLVPDLNSIIIEPVQSVADDSVSILCTLRFADGKMRGAVGVANAGEPGDGGEVMSEQQLQQLASSRAIRNALRVAGIDLIRLIRSRTDAAASPAPAGRTNRDNLVAQAHALGTECGYIRGTDKITWRRLLNNRYGVASSADLTEPQLADLVAMLRTVNEPFKQAA